MAFNIFTTIFGDPVAKQTQIAHLSQAVIVRLHKARLAGDKVAERAALSQLRALAAKGSAEAAAAMRVVNFPTQFAEIATSAAHSVAGIGKTIALFGVLAVGFVAYAYAKGGK